MRFAGIWILIVVAGCETIFPLEFDGGIPSNTNRVFVTGATFAGDLGGSVGADAICQQVADETDLDGTFIAWLSTGTPPAQNAIGRLAGARGWVRVDGQPVADLPSQLGLIGPWMPISKTETNVALPATGIEGVWSATAANGNFVGPSCADWTTAGGDTGGVGNPLLGLAGFTALADRQCDAPQHLYCFETDKEVEIQLPLPTTKIRFTTSAIWIPDGLVNADTLCQGEADDAGLDGTFVALLSTSSGSAASRAADVDYARPDGIPMGKLIDPSPASFATVTAAGEVPGGTDKVWTGGAPGEIATSSLTTCNDWQGVIAGTGTATIGNFASAAVSAYAATQMFPCGMGAHLYCVQQ